ncbi:ImmA/IrrE family metallo-endopeptidase [Pseudonocardia sp. H11422]|uniref:ImmA/IrrE family metallo-endopeptidase n=1 Tax=Pseudonocardia sp. H11422 TaxID=2835866 RepID=UPI001BDC535B|nr:ImmA/IrrE family metallo-endopeptidase [Pseudonocardia sp. H11422]
MAVSADTATQWAMEAYDVRYLDLRKRCASLVHQLDRNIGGIPRPFDLNELLDRIEVARRRPIELHATYSDKNSPCGLLVREANQDIIVYADNTSTVHQTHIILHEIGHMVCEHRGDCRLSTGSLADVIPKERAQLAEHMLARSTYSNEQEQEAEMVGTLIRIAAANPPNHLIDTASLAESESALYGRIVDVFG